MSTTPRARRGSGGLPRLAAAAGALALVATFSNVASAGYGVPERTFLRWSGAVGTLPGNVNSYVFAGPTVTVSVPAGQSRRVRGSASAALGLASPGPQLVHVGLCYQNQSGGAINTFSLSSHIYYGMDDVRRQYSINDTVLLSGGTYNVGYCVKNLNPISINDTDISVGYLVVTPN